MSSDKDILGVSTSLLTVLALAATSKIWVLGLPILLVVDAVEELRSQGIPSRLLGVGSQLLLLLHSCAFSILGCRSIFLPLRHDSILLLRARLF